jgi:hypothetical protein
MGGKGTFNFLVGMQITQKSRMSPPAEVKGFDAERAQAPEPVAGAVSTGQSAPPAR